MNTVKKGKAAEHLFIARCLLNNADCFAPVTEDGRVDVVVNNYKCQVKVIDKYGISLRKVVPRGKGTFVQYTYTSNDIDFIVGVDLSSLDAYIIPVSLTEKYKSKIAKSTFKEYKNKFDLLT